MTVQRDAGESTWPGARHEQRAWTTNPDLHGPSGRRPGHADRVLTEITVEVPPHIADHAVRLSADTRAVCEEAAQQIIALDAGPGRYLSSLAEFLTRSESVASSRIERVYADMDDLARASVGDDASDAAVRTIAATRALRELTDGSDGGAPLTEAAILEAHSVLLAGDLLEGRSAGSYRTQQNWIGGSDFSPRDAVHVPPPPGLVGALMGDLVRLANREDVPAVALAAIVHGQFEAIHPFNDGNGRIGRGLISAVLRRRGTTRRVVIPVAAVMLADVDTYFGRLADYRAGDADALVDYVARSAITAAEAAEESATRLAELSARWDAQVSARRGSAARTLLAGLLDQPILDIAAIEAVTGVSRPRAYDAIAALTDADVVHEITGHGRNRIWVVSDVMDELSALEGRIGSRARPSSRWR